MNLDNLRLGYSDLTETIYIYLPSKTNPDHALKQIKVTKENFDAVAQMAGYVKGGKSAEFELDNNIKKPI